MPVSSSKDYVHILPTHKISPLYRHYYSRYSRLLILLCALCVVSIVNVMVGIGLPNRVHWKMKPVGDRASEVTELIPLNIVIWVPPRHEQQIEPFQKGIMKWIAQSQNIKPCFHQMYGCEMEVVNMTNLDLEALKTADAVLVFMFNQGILVSDLPPNLTSWRRPDQIWIVHAQETPAESFVSELPAGVFNWTISYRRDSDVWLPYGRIEPLDPHIQQQLQNNSELMIGLESLSNFINGKSKLVAGAISNCETQGKRERFIDLMKKTSKFVDIYGNCGSLKINCSFYDNCTGFWNNLTSQYKFFLAFENSFCIDYISEKFWRTLELGMVPVVYGGANYSLFAPPGTLIHANNFDSPKELLNYLEKVGENATEYAKYFDWRRSFKVAEGKDCWDNGNAWCEICEKLRRFKSAYVVNKITITVKTVPVNWWGYMPIESDGYACKPKF